MAERNRRLTETVARESGRLGSFIRQRVRVITGFILA